MRSLPLNTAAEMHSVLAVDAQILAATIALRCGKRRGQNYTSSVLCGVVLHALDRLYYETPGELIPAVNFSRGNPQSNPPLQQNLPYNSHVRHVNN